MKLCNVIIALYATFTLYFPFIAINGKLHGVFINVTEVYDHMKLAASFFMKKHDVCHRGRCFGTSSCSSLDITKPLVYISLLIAAAFFPLIADISGLFRPLRRKRQRRRITQPPEALSTFASSALSNSCTSSPSPWSSTSACRIFFVVFFAFRRHLSLKPPPA